MNLFILGLGGLWAGIQTVDFYLFVKKMLKQKIRTVSR